MKANGDESGLASECVLMNLNVLNLNVLNLNVMNLNVLNLNLNC